MPASEYQRWQAFYAVDPFGDERADLRIAQLTALTANAHSDPKKRRKAYEAWDFMPFSEKPKPVRVEQSPQAVVASVFAIFGVPPNLSDEDRQAFGLPVEQA